jgi:hypothetical protein
VLLACSTGCDKPHCFLQIAMNQSQSSSTSFEIIDSTDKTIDVDNKSLIEKSFEPIDSIDNNENENDASDFVDVGNNLNKVENNNNNNDDDDDDDDDDHNDDDDDDEEDESTDSNNVDNSTITIQNESIDVGCWFGFGNAQYNQLGLVGKSFNSPTLCTLFSGREIKMVACGLRHTLILLQNGSVFGLGANSFGNIFFRCLVACV